MRRRLVLIAALLAVACSLLDARALSVIIADDVSLSTRPIRASKLSAICKTFDCLQVGDKVYPVCFGTYARTLSPAITITGNSDRLKLRTIFENLWPSDRWTYFRDLDSLARTIAAEDSNVVLLCFTDAKSDPGPGRDNDLSISQLATDKDAFQGGGAYAIRVAGSRPGFGVSIVQRLRGDTTGNANAVADTTENLGQMMRRMVGLLRDGSSQVELRLWGDSTISAQGFTHSDTDIPAATAENPAAVMEGSTSIPDSTQPGNTPALVVPETTPDDTTVGGTVGPEPWEQTLRRVRIALLLGLVVLAGIVFLFIRSTRSRASLKPVIRQSEPTVAPEYSDEAYHLIVKVGENRARATRLVKGLSMTLGQEIPVRGHVGAICTITWRDDGVFIEPASPGIMTRDGEPLTMGRRITPGDMFICEDIKVLLSTDPELEFEAEDGLSREAAPEGALLDAESLI